MPWKVEVRNGRHAVVKKGSGQLVSMHQNAAAAQAHVRALYANVNKGPKYKKSRSYKTEMIRSATARRVMKSKKPKNMEDMPHVNPYPKLEKMPRFQGGTPRKPPMEKMPTYTKPPPKMPSEKMPTFHDDPRYKNPRRPVRNDGTMPRPSIPPSKGNYRNGNRIVSGRAPYKQIIEGRAPYRGR